MYLAPGRRSVLSGEGPLVAVAVADAAPEGGRLLVPERVVALEDTGFFRGRQIHLS